MRQLFLVPRPFISHPTVSCLIPEKKTCNQKFRFILLAVEQPRIDGEMHIRSGHRLPLANTGYYSTKFTCKLLKSSLFKSGLLIGKWKSEMDGQMRGVRGGDSAARWQLLLLILFFHIASHTYLLKYLLMLLASSHVGWVLKCNGS